MNVLANRTYRHLFLAQVIALVGTGLATVALSLLAYDLAGADAGAVLGTALAIKMIAYVGVAPIAAAFAERLPRRTMLVALDLIRAAVALLLPFITQIWEIYVLIFVLQSASAAFTPTFQATIPDVLPDEKDYTRALSLSRLAYDMESVVSPMLAAALLTLINFHSLFAGTAVGFIASAALVVSVILPSPEPAEPRGIYDRTTRGIRIYLATPRLRGLLAVTFAVAAASAMVIVNTVVLVQSTFGMGQRATAVALVAFGAGSMIAALTLPRLLELIPDRTAMLAGAGTLTIGLLHGLHAAKFLPALAAVVRHRPRIRACANAIWTIAATLVQPGRPACAVRGAIRAVTRLLAIYVSRRRMAGRNGRPPGNFRGSRYRSRLGGGGSPCGFGPRTIPRALSTHTRTCRRRILTSPKAYLHHRDPGIRTPSSSTVSTPNGPVRSRSEQWVGWLICNAGSIWCC